MKKIRLIQIGLLFLFLITACDFAPQSKHEYFEQYETFIQELQQKKEELKPEEWIDFDKKHQAFSVDFFQKFKADMSIIEKAQARKLGAEYQVLRTKSKLQDIISPFRKKKKEKE